MTGSKEFASLICNGAKTGLFVVDRSEKVQYWNDWMVRRSGIEAGAILGHPVWDFTSSLDSRRFTLGLRHCLKSGMSVFMSRALNGSPLPLFQLRGEEPRLRLQQEIQIIPIRGDDGQRFALVQVNDATSDFSRERELKQMTERYRLASIEAMEASEAKSQFLAIMSHEIRTPLNGVLGMARLVQDTPLDENQRDMVATILESGGTLMTLLNDILDMSKAEAREITLEQLDLNIEELVYSVVSVFQPLAHEKGIGLRLHSSGKSPPLLLGDPTRFRQILSNLISNAVKFTDSGQVDVACRFKADPDADATLVEISVKDTGIGMDEDAQGRIFEAFHQGDKTTTRRFGGTGLGLSLARKLAQLMSGEITVRSAPGQGSCFTFTLSMPNRKPPALSASMTHAAPVTSDRSGPRVLLAEDNVINARITGGFLEKLGLVVDVAEDGRIALEKLRDNDYAVIFMDIHMPEMDGVEATRAIRHDEHETGTRLPIIGLTADAFEENHQRYLAEGMDEILVKPFDEEDLKRVLQAHLGDNT